MRMNLGRQSLGDCDALDDAAHAARGEASAALVDEQRGHSSRRNCFLQRVLRRVTQSGEQLLAPRQVNGKRRERRPSEGDVALLLPFAANQDGFVAYADVIDIDADQL